MTGPVMPSSAAQSCWITGQSFVAAAPFVLFAFLAAVLVARVSWVIYYLYRYRRSGRGSIREALLATSANIEVQRQPDDDIDDELDAYIEKVANDFRFLAQRQTDVSLVGGSVSFAAWTALFIAVSDAGIESGISDRTLALLLSGAMLLLAGPICLRREDFHWNYILRESMLYVGFTVVLFSLCSIAIDLGGIGASIGALIVAFAVVVADLAEVKSHWELLRYKLPEPAGNDPEGDAESQLPAGLA
ncbi:hypothetical protein OG594_45755 [Streptomyces sp. NBC_01214]|nr:hypothetical protein [Streptomyces sp. NBC_01214]